MSLRPPSNVPSPTLPRFRSVFSSLITSRFRPWSRLLFYRGLPAFRRATIGSGGSKTVAGGHSMASASSPRCVHPSTLLVACHHCDYCAEIAVPVVQCAFEREALPTHGPMALKIPPWAASSLRTVSIIPGTTPAAISGRPAAPGVLARWRPARKPRGGPCVSSGTALR